MQPGAEENPAVTYHFLNEKPLGLNLLISIQFIEQGSSKRYGHQLTGSG